jgi:hypothetical protein
VLRRRSLVSFDERPILTLTFSSPKNSSSMSTDPFGVLIARAHRKIDLTETSTSIRRLGW